MEGARDSGKNFIENLAVHTPMDSHCFSTKSTCFNTQLSAVNLPDSLFPLNRRGGFAADVVNDAVDSFDFVDDTGGHSG